MGYPLSTFQQLAHFCRDDRYKSVFDRYKVVAIPFIRPKNQAVRNALKYNFERLHFSTGRYFAFFSFMTPPLRWQKEHPEWMDIRGGLVEGLSTDEDKIIAALQSRFNLPSSPTLLLTDNLRSNSYVVLPVDGNDLVQKMEAIGQFAEQYPERFPMDDPTFNEFLSRYESVFVEETENGESIARNLTDILAVDSLRYKTGKYREAWGVVKREAAEWVRNTLNHLIHKADNAPESEYETELRRYSDYLALTLKAVDSEIEIQSPLESRFDTTSFITPHSFSLNQQVYNVPPFSDRFLFSSETAQYLTEDNRIRMDNYNCLVPFFMRDLDDDIRNYPEYLPTFNGDLSPLGLSLGLIIEEELNASVVQLSRKAVGIRMPQYYRLWDRTHPSIPVIKNEKGTIYLNEKKKKLGRGKHLANRLSIGQTVLAVQQIRKDYPDFPFGVFGEKAFLSSIKKFAPLRNSSAHSGELYGLKKFQATHQAFSNIAEVYFLRMAALKEDLSH